MKPPLDLTPITEALESLLLVSAIARYPFRFRPGDGLAGRGRVRQAGPFRGIVEPRVTSVGNMLVYAAEDNLRSTGSPQGGG